MGAVKLTDSVKVALDELRMQMLGTQVLFGFQLQGTFQDNFDSISLAAHVADAVALALIVGAVGLLVAPACQHRIVERGEATVRTFRTANRFANAALMPLAVAIGCDLFVVSEGAWGRPAATVMALAAAGIAIGLWYGLGHFFRATLDGMDAMDKVKKEDTPLHVKIDQMLTEARVILPGAQALFGFQFTVTLMHAFAAMPTEVRALHFVSLCAVTLSIALLLAPAAIHRIAFGGYDTEKLHNVGSRLIGIAMAPLAIGIAADSVVAVYKIAGRLDIAVGVGCAGLLFLAGLWYGVPYWLRRTGGR
jgi:hypothetical protein